MKFNEFDPVRAAQIAAATTRNVSNGMDYDSAHAAARAEIGGGDDPVKRDTVALANERKERTMRREKLLEKVNALIRERGWDYNLAFRTVADQHPELAPDWTPSRTRPFTAG